MKWDEEDQLVTGILDLEIIASSSKHPDPECKEGTDPCGSIVFFASAVSFSFFVVFGQSQNPRETGG